MERSVKLKIKNIIGSLSSKLLLRVQRRRVFEEFFLSSLVVTKKMRRKLDD